MLLILRCHTVQPQNADFSDERRKLDVDDFSDERRKLLDDFSDERRKLHLDFLRHVVSEVRLGDWNSLESYFEKNYRVWKQEYGKGGKYRRPFPPIDMESFGDSGHRLAVDLLAPYILAADPSNYPKAYKTVYAVVRRFFEDLFDGDPNREFFYVKSIPDTLMVDTVEPNLKFIDEISESAHLAMIYAHFFAYPVSETPLIDGITERLGNQILGNQIRSASQGIYGTEPSHPSVFNYALDTLEDAKVFLHNYRVSRDYLAKLLANRNHSHSTTLHMKSPSNYWTL